MEFNAQNRMNLSKLTLPDRLAKINQIENLKERELCYSIAMKNDYICELEAEIEKLKSNA